VKRPARIVRGANFAYPYSERSNFYSPRTVRLLIGVSAIAVLALVALPFYLEYLEQRIIEQRTAISLEASASEIRLQEVMPILRRKDFLDSLQLVLDTRVGLRRQIGTTDFAMDRLLLHISEIIPDGVVLTTINIAPPERQRAGRPGQTRQGDELPEELQNASVLTLSGTARNATILEEFERELNRSPLLYEPNRQVTVLENSLRFDFTSRVPGTGIELGGEGA